MDPEIQAILDEAGSAQPEAPEGAAPAPAEAAPDPYAWRSSFDWKFKSGDKEVVVDDENKARTWMAQGHNYAQKMGEFNKRVSEWERSQQEREARYKGYDRYHEVNEFAQKNPEWWQFVEQQWSQRETAQVPPELAQHISPLLQRLQQTEGVLQEWQKERLTAKEREEDAKLDQEIQAIRDKYPNIDLSAVDPETGRSLEHRIYQHAGEIGTQSFAVAFKDYLHDRLIEDAKASALAANAKQAQEKAKQGVLGTTQVPTKGLKAPPKGVSWNDPSLDARSILAELGMTN